MFDKLKNLIGGKSDGFFLELDRSEDSQSKKTKTEKTETKKQALSETVTEAIDKAAEAIEPVTGAIKEAVTSDESAKKEETKKSKKTATKNEKKKATKTATAPASTSSSQTSSNASSYDPPFWVKAMYNNSSSSNGQAKEREQTFATDNLLPNPSRYRRRPGPSLDKFKEMARQTKSNSRI